MSHKKGLQKRRKKTQKKEINQFKNKVNYSKQDNISCACSHIKAPQLILVIKATLTHLLPHLH